MRARRLASALLAVAALTLELEDRGSEIAQLTVDP
jgi:hypothetical protein